ncbi:hypothetical protein EQ500_00010 [Lactobacillus sp. XV13L]|nr:hypothetical protein [Lactobacillus sp. XV13L]
MGRTVYPTGTVKFDPSKTWSGYTLFNGDGEGTLLIDMNGKIVHEWKNLQGFPNKMIRGGKVFGSLKARDRYAAYQDQSDVTEVDWDGKKLWSFNHNQEVDDEDTGKVWVARQHHDYQIEGNPVGYYVPGQESNDNFQKMLILTHNNLKKKRVSPQSLLEDVLIEINRSGEIMWSWSLMDHFKEFHLSNIELNAIFRDPNTHDTGDEGEGDIFHCNCASYLGPNKWYDQGDKRFAPDNIIIDAREANIMWIIDHETGKIVWQIGPDYTMSPELRTLGPLVGMHHAHMIPKGLPGAGNILVFNNGGWAGYGIPNQVSKTGMKTARIDTSKVIEFDPITLEVKWTFDSSDLGETMIWHQHRFYSPLVSDTQRLPNGNTLIDEGTEGRFLEVTPDKEVVWEYVYPHVNNYLVYRAYRIPYDWIPQLTKPEEIEVTPPANDQFQVKGAANPNFTKETTVEVEGAAGYGEGMDACVDELD